MKTSIEQFCAITGASNDVAIRMLEACNGNLEVAINMHVDAEESQAKEVAPQLAPSVSTETVSDKAENTSSDGVRAPIPPTRGILVEEPFSFGVHARRKPARSIFDGFRDFEAETRRQEEELFNPSCVSDHKKRQTLEDLFRPPLDIMYKGTFETARQQGQLENKWLMVNLQNVQEFNCQILNRDVWSNPAVKSIIQEHFVFYQVYHDSDEGQRYMQFYKVQEWPYVAIIDPRTGENLVVWNKLDSLLFCDLVTEFLSHHPSVDGSCSLSPPRKRLKTNSIVDASEDSQLEAAIKASLVDSACKVKVEKKIEVNEEEDDSEIETFESDTELSCSSSSTATKADASSKSSASSTASEIKNHDGETTSNCDLDERNGDKNQNEENSEWEKYLGDTEEDVKSNVLLRFPDGNKKQLTLPASSKLKALVLYVALQGFESHKFELVTNFPRRQLSHLDATITLKEAGLYPQETIFVQAR